MENGACWLSLPRRLLGLAYHDAPNDGKASDSFQSPFREIPVPRAAPVAPTPLAPPPSLRTSCGPSEALVADAYAQILAQAEQQRAQRASHEMEESESSDSSDYSDSEDESEHSEGEEETETELSDIRPSEALPTISRDRPIRQVMTSLSPPLSPSISVDEADVERPSTALLTSDRRPSTAPPSRPTSPPSVFAARLPRLSSLAPPTPSQLPQPPSSGLASMRAAAQALAKCVSRAVGGKESKVAETAYGAGTGLGGGKWTGTGTTVSSTALCHSQRSLAPASQQAVQQQGQFRRVPPAALMASPWWRNMEQQSPAFAAVSQRFHAIAQAQARERLASNLARLAVLHEAEEATRQQQEALRNALGMPALAAWAQTKAQDPLPAFLLRTLAALLDLSVEMVKHGVLMGWVLLGVFNRLLFEVLTANRPVQTAVMLIAVLLAGYVGLLGDFTDIEGLFWDI